LAPRFYKKIENKPFCPSRFLKEIEIAPVGSSLGSRFYKKSEKTPPRKTPQKRTSSCQKKIDDPKPP
jgi:hypothetical protein